MKNGTTIERIETHAKKIASGSERVKPGQEVCFTEAATIDDTIRQGDLYLTIVAAVPAGYVKIEKLKASDKQLVPGNTVGSRHCLDSLAGVTLYRPEQWSEESLAGPCLVLAKQRTIEHPTHGAVFIPAGFTVLCRYQREFDAEQKRERRARD
ncbi:MAG: hypothetical protein ACREA9_17530 [Pyrinomonadaceae bacterium]